MEGRSNMIIDKPLIKQSYTYKLTILDTDSGEEKEFLPIHIKEFQLKVYPNKNLLDDEVWNFIWDLSNMNKKSYAGTTFSSSHKKTKLTPKLGWYHLSSPILTLF